MWWPFGSAAGAARRIAARELSSREVVAACLDRIAETGPVLNAVVALRADAAAGGSPLGLGSDSGGSIRQPAHCCGVAGLTLDYRRRPRSDAADEWVDGGGSTRPGWAR